MPVDLIWTVVGFLLTLMMLSYIFGDNVLFRLASYLFVGVSAAYVALTLIVQVISPKLFTPLVFGTLAEKVVAVVPLILGMLLVMKLSPRLARLGNLSMAYLIGVSAAVMVGGVVLGSLIPQIVATTNAFDLQSAVKNGTNPFFQLVDGLYIAAGTIATLMFFYFGAKSRPNTTPERSQLVSILAKAGQVFIGITLGAVFAGVYAAALAALIERVSSFWNSLFILFKIFTG
jgi:hypothetical protein